MQALRGPFALVSACARLPLSRPSRPLPDPNRVGSVRARKGQLVRGDQLRQEPPDFTLPRSRRLQNRRDFLRIQQAQGARVSTPHFVLALGANPDDRQAPSRLGVTVSKQVSKKAVERGRCKRLVREAFRLEPGLLPPGVDLVVIVRAGAQSLGLADVQREWGAVRSLIGRKAAGVVRSVTLRS